MKKGIFKGISVVICVIMLFSVLAACGGTSGKTDSAATSSKEAASSKSEQAATTQAPKPVKVVLGHPWPSPTGFGALMIEQLNKFKEENKDAVILEETTDAAAQYQEKMKASAATNKFPDIFVYWLGGNIKPFVELGVVLPTDDYFAFTTNKYEDFRENAWASVTFDGVKYGVPVDQYGTLLLANRELFNKYGLKYPSSYEDLLNVSKVFRENDIIPMSMGSNGGAPGIMFVSYMALMFKDGAESMKDLLNYNFNNEANLGAAKAIADLRKNKVFQEDTVGLGGYLPYRQLYIDGKAAMIPTFTYNIGNFPPEVAAISDVIPFPQLLGTNCDTTRFTLGGPSWGIFISKKAWESADDSKKAAITRVMDFFTSQELASAIASGTGSVPVRKNIEIKTDNPIIKQFAAMVSSMDIYPEHEFYVPDPSITTVLYRETDELFAGTKTPEEFITNVQKECDSAKGRANTK